MVPTCFTLVKLVERSKVWRSRRDAAREKRDRDCEILRVFGPANNFIMYLGKSKEVITVFAGMYVCSMYADIRSAWAVPQGRSDACAMQIWEIRIRSSL